MYPAYDSPQNWQKFAINYYSEEIWNVYIQNKDRNVNIKTQKVQKTIDKGCINQGQVADDLIKIKKGGSMKIVP